MLEKIKALLFGKKDKPVKPSFSTREEIRSMQKLGRTYATTRSGRSANNGSRRSDSGSRDFVRRDTDGSTFNSLIMPSLWSVGSESSQAADCDSGSSSDSGCGSSD